MAEIWETIKSFFQNNGWKIAGWFLTLVIGIIAIKLIINALRRIFNRSKMEKIAAQFLIGLIKVVLYLILVLILLSQMGVEITGIITACSAVLLAIGVALENNISNLANGIIIVSTKMFKKGDFISVNGMDGKVENINFLFTTLMTTDNRKITLPNNALVNNAVINVSANGERRVDITFSVAYETDVELVKKIITDVMKSNGKVYDDDKHPIFCKLKTLNSSSLDFFSYCWCDKEDYWDVYYYVVDKVYNEFKKHGVSVPFAQMEIRNRTDEVIMPFDPSPLPERVEKIRKKEEKFDLESSDIFEEAKKLRKKKKEERAEKKQNKKREKEKNE